MSHKPLSTLQMVSLRHVWPNEALDFTPWLAEHIDELGDALGIELETQQREAHLSGGYLDILARDVDSGCSVAIENQLGNSDDNHLGRLLIYTARTDADIVIWIARDFEEAHWLVLNWLNDRTDKRTRFFGVAIEAWRIDDSPPAPYFRVVSAPRDWRRKGATPRYREFRMELEARLKQAEPDLPLQAGAKHSGPWLAISHVQGLNYSFDFRDDMYFSFQLDTRGGQSLDWCYQAFERLEEDSESIESSLGRLEWRREWQSGRGSTIRGSTIMSHHPGTYSGFLSSWPEVHDWVVERYRRFWEVFEPYREELLRDPSSRAATEGHAGEG